MKLIGLVLLALVAAGVNWNAYEQYRANVVTGDIFQPPAVTESAQEAFQAGLSMGYTYENCQSMGITIPECDPSGPATEQQCRNALNGSKGEECAERYLKQQERKNGKSL